MRKSTDQLQEVFLKAIQIKTPAERRSYVERACSHNPHLIGKVVSRLDAHYEDGNPTEVAPDPAKTQIMERMEDAPGSLIGQYKIRERLGEGGMGIVYLAEQMEPIRRKLALKIIKPGMDSRNVIARFEAERQALAMMSHPNIARILDGGTTEEGRPYFVMELVRGVPINEYCDQHQLTIRERLQLFISVCHAVQHAHMKGIIHRDLKPSNILVEQHGDEAVPKVIDFGIAKALDQQLTEQTVYTQFAQLIGTPEYMSPEQARLSEVDIDTRSDIYSLGIMLYELLTGMLPYATKPDSRIGFDEIRRIISEDEPRRPSQKLSTLDNQLISTVSHHRRSDPKQLVISMRRELDWVALKAIEKDRSRRYQTATALAEDIQRYLNHEPVQACPPSITYRLRKQIYLHRTFLLATALVLATALAGTAFSVRYATQAREARRNTEQVLYATDLILASEYLKQGDYRSFSDTIDQMAVSATPHEDFRGFEWWYLKQMTTVPSQLLESRDEQGCLVRFSRDGRYLVLGWTDGRIDVKDAVTHKTLLTLKKHGDFVNGCDFHPSREILATIGDDGSIRLWDLTNGDQIKRFTVCEKRDDRQLHGHRVFFSADGEMLISSGEEGRVRYWETMTGKELNGITGFSSSDHSGVEERLDCSPSGRLLAIADGNGAGAVYDLQTRKRLTRLQGVNVHDSIRRLRFSPDEKYIAGCKKSHDVYIWRTDNGNQVAHFKGHLDDVQDLAFHPTQEWLVSCDRAGVIRRWDFGQSSKKPQSDGSQSLHLPKAFRGHTDRIWSLDFSTDGSALVTGSRDDTIRLWSGEVERSQQSLSVEAPVKVFFIHGGEDLLIADQNQLKIWNRTTRTYLTLAETAAPIIEVCVNEQKKMAVTVDENDAVQFWSLETGQFLSEFRFEGDGRHRLSISPDARLLAISAYLSSVVNLRDITAVNDPRLLLTFGGEDVEERDAFDAAWLAPDNRSLVMHRLNELHIYDVINHKEARVLQNHTNGVSSVDFGNGSKLMASGSNDRTVCLWNFTTGELLHCISAHKNEVTALALSPDGRTLVSGDSDGIIVFSHVNTGRVLFETQMRKKDILDLKFSPDGQWLAVVQKDNLSLLSGVRQNQVDVAKR